MKTASTDKWRYRRVPNTNYHHEEDVGYYALAAAIVKQAVEDYKYADSVLNGIKTVKPTSWAARMAHNAENTKDEVVRFFRGQWYGTLCDIDPELILKKLGAIK